MVISILLNLLDWSYGAYAVHRIDRICIPFHGDSFPIEIVLNVNWVVSSRCDMVNGNHWGHRDGEEICDVIDGDWDSFVVIWK